LHQLIVVLTQKKGANLMFQVSQFTGNQHHVRMSRCQHLNFDACLHK
jgi:hypothetical protein